MTSIRIAYQGMKQQKRSETISMKILESIMKNI